jgi:hypothetical protein
MTTPPVDGQPPTDIEDPTPSEPSGSQDGNDESSGTDAMGIDDDDPIDATLVGEPVDSDEDTGAAKPSDAV